MRQKLGALIGSLFIITLVIASMTPIGAIGIGVSPSKIGLGTLGRGGSAQETARIYNLDNVTAMNFTITSNSPLISAYPNHGTLGPKSNESIVITAQAGSNDTNGPKVATLLVNSSTVSNFGGASLLPAVAVKVTYTVNGVASPAASASNANGVDWSIVGAGLGILAVIGVVAVAWSFRPKRGDEK